MRKGDFVRERRPHRDERPRHDHRSRDVPSGAGGWRGRDGHSPDAAGGRRHDAERRDKDFRQRRVTSEHEEYDQSRDAHYHNRPREHSRRVTDVSVSHRKVTLYQGRDDVRIERTRSVSPRPSKAASPRKSSRQVRGEDPAQLREKAARKKEKALARTRHPPTPSKSRPEGSSKQPGEWKPAMKDSKVKVKPKKTPEEKSEMDILELEMRARAIKAMLERVSTD